MLRALWVKQWTESAIHRAAEPVSPVLSLAMA